MADFCKQCSIEIFGEDLGDLKGKELKPGHGWLAICEGCGPTLVDGDGKCISPDCPSHGRTCNRCQAPNALWYNHGSLAWYCAGCRQEIEFDPLNKWEEDFQPHYGHPQFETREMMEARNGH